MIIYVLICIDFVLTLKRRKGSENFTIEVLLWGGITSLPHCNIISLIQQAQCFTWKDSITVTFHAKA